jgi:hypothetical protein
MADAKEAIAEALREIAAEMRAEDERRRSLLSVSEVRSYVGCGDRKAREIMLSLTHVRIGKLLKIRRDVLEKWLKQGGSEWRDSTSVKRPGGVGDTTSTASDGPSRRSSGTESPQVTRLARSNAATRLTPRSGHGRNSHSKKR